MVTNPVVETAEVEMNKLSKSGTSTFRMKGSASKTKPIKTYTKNPSRIFSCGVVEFSIFFMNDMIYNLIDKDVVIKVLC